MWKKGCFGNTSYLYIVLIPYSEHRFFAVDDQSLEYLRQTGRADETIKKVEAYLKAIDAAIAGDPGAAEDAVVEDCTEVIKQGTEGSRS